MRETGHSKLGSKGRVDTKCQSSKTDFGMKPRLRIVNEGQKFARSLITKRLSAGRTGTKVTSEFGRATANIRHDCVTN